MNSNFDSMKISILGLGYVGLPLAIALSKKYKVVGFDINKDRVLSLKQNIDNCNEISSETLKNSKILFSFNSSDLKNTDLFIVTVPTPIDENHKPDLKLIKKASLLIGSFLNKKNCVIYESTVYPGVTEDICVPILETESGLTLNKDFSVAYSPERLSPGSKGKKLEEIVKIVSASNNEALTMISDIYQSIIPAGIYKAPSIKVAEMAKVLENTQRDLNVSLMNELSKICHLIDISSSDVINAAGTKWNFIKLTPGLVGGHCIGVDPYYLTYLSIKKGYEPEVILAGRKVNNEMPKYIAQQCIKLLSSAFKPIHSSKVLVMGLSYKENINDIRNSKVPAIISELQSFGVKSYLYDPLVDQKNCLNTYQLDLLKLQEIPKVDAVICAVGHDIFTKRSLKDWLDHIKGEKIFLDIKGIFKSQIEHNTCKYWCL